MYDGWLTTFGTEIVNIARLAAYRDALLPTLPLRGCTDCADLTAAVEDDPYTTPQADDAPWFDVDTPDSDKFLGFMATSLEGFEDSTREAGTMESLFDGGTVGRVRRKTREMRVTLVGIGATHAAVSAGLSWLKSAMNGNLCDTCDDSDDICFFTACPPLGADGDSFIRHIRRAKCVAGPTVIAERELNGCGGWIIQVEMTFVAGSPYVYGEPLNVAYATGSELTAMLPGAETFPMTEPLQSCWADLDKPKSSILRDPDCPPVPKAPTIPAVSSVCKSIDFASYSYLPTKKVTRVQSTPYASRPLLARKGSTWLSVYSSGATRGIAADQVLKAKTSTTSGASWSSEYTLYNEGSGTKGLEPAGITYASDVDKFFVGVNVYDFATSNPRKYQGVILTSSTGASGSWTVTGNLDAAMAKWGAKWYYMTDVEHHENGTTYGITYAAVFTEKPGDPRRIVLILRSLDGGVTWAVLSQPWVQNDRSAFQYPQIALWPNGAIGVLTQATQTREILFKRSVDGGKSWTPSVVAATAASGIPAPVITNDGGIMFMYRDMRKPGARGLGMQNYRYSKDQGRRWSAGSSEFASNSPAGQMGADWAVAANGDIGVVFSLDYSNTSAITYWTMFWQRENYLSYAIGVPDTALRAWADGVMMLQIKTGAKASRQMRVRLIPRPLPGQLPEDLDPCSVCSEFIIDYAPANTIVYLDGMTERVTMRVGNGVPQPADHLVSGPNGSMFSWPLFSCGLGYFVLVDTDVSTVTSLALAVSNRE